jgi:type I restriction enzyme, S subunit
MSLIEVKIGDLGKVITGNTPPKKDPNNYDGAYPFIKPTDMVIDKRHVTEWEENYSEKAYKQYHRSYIPPGSTGVVTIGTVGEKLFQAHQYCFTNQSVNVIIPNDKYNDNYVFYLMKLNLPKVESANPGTASGRHHVSKSNFSSIKVDVIKSIDSQKRIADILSAYDDLIENNLKRIKLLEQAAQNIYKEWFVNLRFPGHENTSINEETCLPEGWEIKRADEVFKVNIGKTPPRKEPEWFSFEKGYKWISISDMNKSSVFIQKTKEFITAAGVSRFNVRVVPKGTVLLSFKLTIGSVVIASEDMVTNEAIAHFNIDKNTALSTEYTYCYLSCFQYKTLGSTSSIGQALNSKIVKSMPVLLPQNDLVSLFTKKVTPIFTQLENLITQNRKLKAARDILLPRLMNRTIEV